MREFLYGTPAVVLWSILTMFFAFSAAWSMLWVWQVGGIRGTALSTLCSCLAVVTGSFAILLSDAPVVPKEWVAVAVTVVFYPMVLAVLVLVDIYAADQNSHRSAVTRFYMWYTKMTKDDRQEINQ